MKILLIGEYSGLHNHLKKGLERLGNEVIIWADADGFKSFPSDIRIIKESKSKIIKGLNIFWCSINMKHYDIVQMINYHPFPRQFQLNKNIIRYLLLRNKKLFIVGAGGSGSNTILANYFKYDYKYRDIYLFDSMEGELWSLSSVGKKYNEWINSRIHGYIPIMFEYAEPYRRINYNKLNQTIPLPIDTETVHYSDNIVSNKIKFFYGLNRQDKGTDLIVPAMERLKENYPDEVEIVVDGKMPIDQYLKLLETVNVVIDQAYSVSYGMNALYAMAKGRVVVGGGEEECLQEFGLTECPIVPINPDVDDIYNKLVMVLERKDEILEWGRRSREFVETHHDAVKIAAQYLEVWENA